MKLPSFFKTPRNQKFTITPRYYDPIKEEIEERTSRIRREMMIEEGDDGIEGNFYDSRLVGSFRQNRSKVKRSANMMQMVIILLMVGGLVGFWFFGNIALYAFVLISSVLLYLKIKHII